MIEKNESVKGSSSCKGSEREMKRTEEVQSDGRSGIMYEFEKYQNRKLNDVELKKLTCANRGRRDTRKCGRGKKQEGLLSTGTVTK